MRMISGTKENYSSININNLEDNQKDEIRDYLLNNNISFTLTNEIDECEEVIENLGDIKILLLFKSKVQPLKLFLEEEECLQQKLIIFLD